ncbi:unnamed protein product [Pseudo-nitzschia multistriata]|uniref:Pre-mRNA processing factor 4 (PRP4)-like domain-containing protein n=1 Tax=Pseudo-nitzschia multistriata TaxID=183589 RepID=A0A448Z0T5_9STRA|nr:unnamed protein product [Pseudo-nitzschia multistriata]
MAAVPTTALGNSSVATAGVEVMELTAASRRGREEHEEALLDMEARNRAFSVDVPTLPQDVRTSLRAMGLPVRLFGENPANVRDRLRMAMARELVRGERGASEGAPGGREGARGATKGESAEPEEAITKYSRASQGLVKARERFSAFSLDRARDRLDQERTYRAQWQRKRARLVHGSDPCAGESDHAESGDPCDGDQGATEIETDCLSLYRSVRKMGAEGSQYGDPRPLSCIASVFAGTGGNPNPLVATGSWSGTIKLWDASLHQAAERTLAHEDRIMGIATKPQRAGGPLVLATSSIDRTAKLWTVRPNDGADGSSETEQNGGNEPSYLIEEAAHLRGHANRLCKVAFHPMGDHLVTTSFDHTWRMWDAATGTELLLQDGHAREVYGVGFHPDGSLCSTTDYGGVVQLWDLRTGRSVHHFLGHARRVFCAEFAPNGFQLATAGDDGTLKIWDLRRRRLSSSVPAHSGLVTQLLFQDREQGGVGGGEFLVSASFDGTARVWSARDWKILATLRGHEGKVTGAGILGDGRQGLVTCGFDKTLKLWR